MMGHVERTGRDDRDVGGVFAGWFASSMSTDPLVRPLLMSGTPTFLNRDSKHECQDQVCHTSCRTNRERWREAIHIRVW